MKILKFFVIALFFLFILSGCKKEDDIKIISVSFYDYDDTVIGEVFVESLDKIEMPNISRKGYTLEEWVKIEETDQNISYKAKYVPNKYVLKFTTDGTIIPNLEVTYNETIELPIPEKQNYIFMNWIYEGKELNQNFLYDYDKDIRIVAEYRHKDSFLVEYKDTDGTLYKKMYVLNIVQASCDIPIKEGYTFVKWIKTEELNKVTFTAEFKANIYNFYFASNTNVTYKNYVFTYGGTLEYLPEPTKQNYTFMGWYYNNEKIELPYVLNIPHDVTIYAKWERANYSSVSYQEYVDFIGKADKLMIDSNQLKIASKIDCSISTIIKGTTVSVWSSADYNYKIDKQNDYYERYISDNSGKGYEIYRKINDDIYLDKITSNYGTYYLDSKFHSKVNTFEYKVDIFSNEFKENESFRKIDADHYLAYTTLGAITYNDFDLEPLAEELKVTVNDIALLGVELEISIINNEIIFKASISDFTYVTNDMTFRVKINITHKVNEINVPITQFDYLAENIITPAATRISEINKTTVLSKKIYGYTTPNPHYYRVELQKGLYALVDSTFKPDQITILNKDLETFKFNDIWYNEKIFYSRVFYIETTGTYYLKIVDPDAERYSFEITKCDYKTVANINNPIPLGTSTIVEFEGIYDLSYYSFTSGIDCQIIIDNKGKNSDVFIIGPSGFVYLATYYDGKFIGQIEKGYNLLIFTSHQAQTVEYSFAFK